MGKEPYAFISYRRADSEMGARAVLEQLRYHLGEACVFMDVAGILAGEAWPERLERELDRATVLIVLIGPQWLKAADDFGRRRLDQPQDWVRREICHAIDSKIPMIPIMIEDVSDLPLGAGLPKRLKPLLRHQRLTLCNERWEDDMRCLVETLVSAYAFRRTESKAQDYSLDRDKWQTRMLASSCEPNPADGERSGLGLHSHATPLTGEEIGNALLTLSGWVPVETADDYSYPKSRLELRKAYSFRSFRSAIEFMNFAGPTVDEWLHHPRWENRWRLVIVYLTTWDIGNRISEIDVKLAHRLDSLYEQFIASDRRK
jgi:pterin-4a-carbinolamine dehydratase